MNFFYSFQESYPKIDVQLMWYGNKICWHHKRTCSIFYTKLYICHNCNYTINSIHQSSYHTYDLKEENNKMAHCGFLGQRRRCCTCMCHHLAIQLSWLENVGEERVMAALSVAAWQSTGQLYSNWTSRCNKPFRWYRYTSTYSHKPICPAPAAQQFVCENCI